MRKNVLITGGAGYIGSHAAKYLHRAGFTPIVYDNFSRGHRQAVKWGPLIEGNLLDRDGLKNAMRMFRPVAVMHFAAYAYVGESVTNPGIYYENNVTGTLRLLEAMRDTQTNNLVFSSSCATYGIPDQVPVTEISPLAPINPYGRSKKMAEILIDDFGSAHGIRSICLRYFNAAGADPEGEIGEDHSPETHLIPLCLSVASGELPCIRIYGDDYNTPDGTCIRDYIHVEDLARAHAGALDYLLRGGSSQKINLGNSLGHSVMQIIKNAERITQKTIPLEIHSRRPGDPPMLIGDASRARNILGWKPTHSSLDMILSTAWNWHQRKS